MVLCPQFELIHPEHKLVPNISALTCSRIKPPTSVVQIFSWTVQLLCCSRNSSLYLNRRLITVFTKPRRSTLYWITSLQFNLLHLIYKIRFNIILLFTPEPMSRRWIFLSLGFPTRMYSHHLMQDTSCKPRPYHPPRSDHLYTTGRGTQLPHRFGIFDRTPHLLLLGMIPLLFPTGGYHGDAGLPAATTDDGHFIKRHDFHHTNGQRGFWRSKFTALFTGSHTQC
jgi:hypothetical protein